MSCKVDCPNKEVCSHGYCAPHSYSYCKCDELVVRNKKPTISKLDNIILKCANKVLDGKEEKLGDYIDPTKQDIKSLFIEILDTTDVLGPEHPQTNLWYADLKKRIEEL